MSASDLTPEKPRAVRRRGPARYPQASHSGAFWRSVSIWAAHALPLSDSGDGLSFEEETDEASTIPNERDQERESTGALTR